MTMDTLSHGLRMLAAILIVVGTSRARAPAVEPTREPTTLSYRLGDCLPPCGTGELCPPPAAMAPPAPTDALLSPDGSEDFDRPPQRTAISFVVAPVVRVIEIRLATAAGPARGSPSPGTRSAMPGDRNPAAEDGRLIKKPGAASLLWIIALIGFAATRAILTARERQIPWQDSGFRPRGL